MSNSILFHFNQICSFRDLYPGIPGTGMKSDDPRVKEILRSQKIILEGIKEQMPPGYESLTYKTSPGASMFPHIPYVAILPPDQSVSNGIYVAICFDKFGRGALVGCGESNTTPQGIQTAKRAQQNELFIDVDGDKPGTKYNDAFVQPKEFHFPLSSEEELIRHIKASLDIAFLKIKGEEVNLENESPIDEGDDERNKILRLIRARQGQSKFRSQLIKQYGKCVISGCDVITVLEAAHVIGYKGAKSNNLSNGLLLRADIHTLFDRGLIAISPITRQVLVSPSLNTSEYFLFEGKELLELKVSKAALEVQYDFYKSVSGSK